MTISRDMQILAGVLVALCSYLIGNISNAIMLSKMKGKDIRKCGSGNPGTMNMIRTFGKPIGALALTLDLAKGIVPCLLGWLFMGDGQFLTLGPDRIGLYVAGLCVTLGHIFPVFYKFKGGKGAATIIGVGFTLQPFWALGFFVLGVLFLILTKIGSLTSFIMMSAPLAVEGPIAAQNPYGAICVTIVFVMFALSAFAHRSNLVKLFSGYEGKVVLIRSKKKKPPVDRSAVFENVTIVE